MSRSAVGKIGIEGDDDVRLVEVIDGVDVAAERHAHPFTNIVATHRFPLMPLESRILRKELPDLRAERRRRHGLRQQSQCAGALEGSLQCPDEFTPRGDFAEVPDDLRAVGIVEAKNRRLHEGIGCTETRRMIGIALDLRRPSHVALDEDAGAESAERHRAREEHRLSGNQIFGLLGIRDDFFRWPIAGC